ncbi:hypothetical protein T439DRAFT_135666 [Meredithblackwellia eburnea MCA 4105]
MNIQSPSLLSIQYSAIMVHPAHGIDWVDKTSNEPILMDELPQIQQLDLASFASSESSPVASVGDLPENHQDEGYFHEYDSYMSSSSSSISTFNTSDMLFDYGSPSSSASSTPTIESPLQEKSRPINASSPAPPCRSSLSIAPFFFESKNFFPSPGQPLYSKSQPSTPLYPPVSLQGSMCGGATMQRSVSLPVEQEHVLRKRLSQHSLLHEVAHAKSPCLSRQPSSSGPLRRPLARRGTESAVTGLGLLVAPNGDSTVSPRPQENSSYPYNIYSTSPKRTPISRSYSSPNVHIVATLPGQDCAPLENRQAPPPVTTRPRRPTLDFKMTPIIQAQAPGSVSPLPITFAPISPRTPLSPVLPSSP